MADSEIRKSCKVWNDSRYTLVLSDGRGVGKLIRPRGYFLVNFEGDDEEDVSISINSVIINSTDGGQRG